LKANLFSRQSSAKVLVVCPHFLSCKKNSHKSTYSFLSPDGTLQCNFLASVVAIALANVIRFGPHLRALGQVAQQTVEGRDLQWTMHRNALAVGGIAHFSLVAVAVIGATYKKLLDFASI